MSEEEKKAIEYLKKHIIPLYENGKIEMLINEIALNLIEKQAKEIEEYKAYIKRLDELNSKDFYFKHEAIPKQKIKEILENIKSHNYKGNLEDAEFIQKWIKDFEKLLEREE